MGKTKVVAKKKAKAPAVKVVAKKVLNKKVSKPATSSKKSAPVNKKAVSAKKMQPKIKVKELPKVKGKVVKSIKSGKKSKPVDKKKLALLAKKEKMLLQKKLQQEKKIKKAQLAALKKQKEKEKKELASAKKKEQAAKKKEKLLLQKEKQKQKELLKKEKLQKKLELRLQKEKEKEDKRLAKQAKGKGDKFLGFDDGRNFGKVDGSDVVYKKNGDQEIRERVAEEVFNLAEDFSLNDIFSAIKSLDFFKMETDECQERACDNPATAGGFCRFHYIKNWIDIKKKQAVLSEGRLQTMIEELTSKHSPKHLEDILNDLSDDKTFCKVLRELDIDPGVETIEDFSEESFDEPDITFEARVPSKGDFEED